MSAYPIRWDSWELTEAADRRFRLICLQIGIPVLAFALLMHFTEVRRKLAPAAVIPVHPYARLLPPPPPPPPQVQPEPEPVAEAPPEPIAQPEPEPVIEPKPQPRVERRPEPRPEPTPEQLAAQARERAARSGLVSMSDDLAALRDLQAADRVASGAAVISGTGAPPKQAAPAGGISEGRGSSGGIDTAGLSRDVGAQKLSERSTAKVQAEPGTAPAERARKGSARDREEVEEVFAKNKGAIYAIYNRALRDNPALQGKMVLQLTIEPDGSLSSVEVLSSELGDPALEARLVERIKLFRFEAKDVGTVVINKPIDFFPAD